MSITQLVPSQQQQRILHDAVRQQRRVVLTHHGVEGWRLFKGRFSGGSTGNTLVVQLPRDHLEYEPRFNRGDTLGCTFRDGHRKCICTTAVEALRPHGADILVVLRRPDQVQQLQRRAFERAVPPPSQVIAVRFWREHPVASAAAERQVRHGQLVDISAGGMRVCVAAPQDIEMNVCYRCAFTPAPGRPALVLDALLRHREAEEHGRAALGFQFVGLETTPEGRKALDRLARLVARFQRSRQRRRRGDA